MENINSSIQTLLKPYILHTNVAIHLFIS